MSDEPEQRDDELEPATPPADAAERIKAARERDEARAEADDQAPELEPAADDLSDEQLLELLPPDLRAAIDAGAVDPAPILAATREAVTAGGIESLQPMPAPADPLAEARDEYLAAVRAALGDEAEILPCAHCEGRGFNPLERLPSQHHRRCDECGGEGYVNTGSKVETQARLACEGCGGNGWVRVLVQAEAPPVPVAQAYTPPPPPPPPPPVAVVPPPVAQVLS